MMSDDRLWQRLTPLYDEGEAKAIVRWALEAGFSLTPADIYSGKLEALSVPDRQKLEAMMQRLEKAEPVQYVLGAADFCGRSFRVGPGVLIPRPETEELCQWIIGSQQEGQKILDIGTGSGCIAITLAAEMPHTQVTAWDISDKALQIAAANSAALQTDVTFEHVDILHSSLPASWDLIVSNPPYIDEATERRAMSQNVVDYEPHEALFAPQGEPDLFYRRIGDYAIRYLSPGGQLYFELNPLTAERVRHYLEDIGFHGVEIRHDQFGKQRMLRAIKPNQI